MIDFEKYKVRGMHYIAHLGMPASDIEEIYQESCSNFLIYDHDNLYNVSYFFNRIKLTVLSYGKCSSSSTRGVGKDKTIPLVDYFEPEFLLKGGEVVRSTPLAQGKAMS